MDVLSLIGLLLAATAILGGAILKGAGVKALLSSAAFMIVIVGTVAAICVQTPLPVMKRALRLLPWLFRPPTIGRHVLVQKMVEWSNTARKQGLLGLEPMIEQEHDEFVRKGLQLVVDGSEPDVIRNVLEVDLNVREQADTRAAKVFEGMGIYSPTLGIIGAVMGLMAVMQNLADPSKLGHGIAAAFIATIYGIGMANLFFLPAANKLKVAIQAQSEAREMVIEGMISIAQGENPRSIESKLQGYLH
ncbi:flagellar motor protein [Steroidobacter denitrificans]|uniref:Flagellar motor protein n=1 Tax=Steroidobacter denitrificans TaxID=465721 RepID=A0A127F890_STEDE|nr:flagellar motor protein [Steroidobacter denitrificans]AMN46617.1 flagellar motor protein [Steroidobacter denitrificans]